MDAETPGHRKLKQTLKKILENSKFDLVDTEVQIDIDDDSDPEFSIDVCALEKNILFVFQCKDVYSLKSPKKEVSSTQSYMEKVLAKKFEVIKSDFGKISTHNLTQITDIKCCYAFTNKLTRNPETILKSKQFVFWNNNAIKYYVRVSQILQELTKNEILKEFNVPFLNDTFVQREAVEVRQGDTSMYLVEMPPGLLLKIAYAYRRTSGKPNAYQRIVTKDRIKSISHFFQKAQNLLLPNPVIIAFDDDEEIQSQIKYESNKLTFPVRLCSAWIIDGQHRIYGFKDHPLYNKWSPNESVGFNIPVVVFIKLPSIDQNKTFLNINFYQKRIDSILFNDLSTVIQDLNYEITWPSLLVSALNKAEPWKNMIKISELDTKKPITISGFAKLKLLSQLLGFNKNTRTYSGNLYRLEPFDPIKPFSHRQNKIAFSKQLSTLIRFFTTVREVVRTDNYSDDMWLNHKEYGLTKFISVNALLLVLDKLLEHDLSLSMNLNKLLSPIREFDFKNEMLCAQHRCCMVEVIRLCPKLLIK